MFRRSLWASVIVLALSAGRADALTVREVIDLSKAGLGDSVLLALIEVEHSVFPIDTATVKELKAAGVSDTIIVAMIRSGRERPVEPPPVPAPPPISESQTAPERPQPEVIVIDHHDAPPPQPVAYPVAVPVYLPVAPVFDGRLAHDRTVTTTLSTDQGIVRARVPVPPNCVKAEPVYWGFGGKLRPGSWEPPPTVVCR
jgi:hypothetical protein